LADGAAGVAAERAARATVVVVVLVAGELVWLPVPVAGAGAATAAVDAGLDTPCAPASHPVSPTMAEALATPATSRARRAG
jgi:hypothetical protein